MRNPWFDVCKALQQIPAFLRWTKTSYAIMSVFLAVIALIIVVWWPLVVDYFSQADPRYPLWLQLDWLLIGLFAFMSLAIMAGADLKRDSWIVWIGLCGGLVIEGWGTQTQIWTYFTHERPPLWIIPAWPIASLTIDRLTRLTLSLTRRISSAVFKGLYWLLLPGYFFLMLSYVWPTLDRSLTILAVVSCALLICTPGNYRYALLAFFTGSALGYFLEIWGTTRFCWTYYTHETPPIFAVFAHGLAALAFWRVGEIFSLVIRSRIIRISKRISSGATLPQITTSLPVDPPRELG